MDFCILHTLSESLWKTDRNRQFKKKRILPDYIGRYDKPTENSSRGCPVGFKHKKRGITHASVGIYKGNERKCLNLRNGLLIIEVQKKAPTPKVDAPS